MKQSIVKWLFELNAKQREVLARRFGLLGYEAATLEDVGREIGLTRERVRQIQVEGLRRLREILQTQAEYRSAVPRVSKHLSERPVSSEAGLFLCLGSMCFVGWISRDSVASGNLHPMCSSSCAPTA